MYLIWWFDQARKHKRNALELSKKGYNAFALIYRPGAQTACEDLSRALAFIFENADELGVSTDDYSLWGGSAGARMAAWVGGYGTAAFGEQELPQPAAVIMQYTSLSEYSKNDPPTFVTVGESDGIADWRIMKRRLDGMSALGIPTEFHSYPGLSHGFGAGIGTIAEGWIDKAIDFWEVQSNQQVTERFERGMLLARSGKKMQLEEILNERMVTK